MGLSDLTADAVALALSEFDDLGGDAFRSKYGFGPGRTYFIVRGGKRYDSKAVAGAAHGYLPGNLPLKSADFTGGDQSVARRLRSLGYNVHSERLDWVRDEVILVCDVLMDNDWDYLGANDPRVLELSTLLQKMPLYPPEIRGDKFRNPNGVARKTADIATQHPDYKGKPTKGGAVDKEVLAEYLRSPDRMRAVAAALRSSLHDETMEQVLQAPIDDEDDSAPEGRLLQRQHFVRERDRKLRRKKIDNFLETHDRVACEVCGFDPEAVYGERGREYTEVHHVLPLHVSGETRTKMSDLVLLCANCHRMIHRRSPWLSPDELRALMKISAEF
ncbi:HNH endonuclease [Rhodococcus sp. 06-235-1A]|uniref:HNH endonuclease n=1 Tax=Rhodococcus sp. 06-235-1A TaxID=2022508 RepID=UPI000B9AEFEA|nr:HNH endonuclease [Rhodococcus sp. 06-235-1A]OZD05113.1 HNH endonuclease [Rhodococcus sp. 06-235-1A]